MTRKQYKLFKFVQSSEVSPTYAEIAAHMGMGHPKTAHSMVTRMVVGRLLERTRAHRSIRVVVE